jgi:phosphoglycerol transferase MdoB-like AlkP superfamily enzyme
MPFSGKTFFLGLRYDLRIIAMLLLPLFIITGLRRFSPFHNKMASKVWLLVLTIIYSLVCLCFVVDYYFYAYRNTRLTAEILGYFQDAGISLQMVVQSYPIFKILLGLILLITVLYIIIKFLMRQSQSYVAVNYKPNRPIWSTIFLIFLLLCIWGNIGQYPLRWSDATDLNNDFKANMATNPFQSFASSYKFRNEKIDMDKVKKYYPSIASFLQLPLTDTTLNFERKILSDNANNTQPNIIVVLCESYSYYKSSMCNNPLNPTPYFNQLRHQGIFFTKCFTPAYGTARGVWATLTGIPDVNITKTATRNPALVNQHLIMNDFVNYEKFYFLGGSASWANIRGLIKNNIENVHLYEQEDYSSPVVDVWGISDKNLFLEANTVLTKQQKPFVAVIQTANNHRPYTIPNEDGKEMGILTKTTDSLNNFGFSAGNDEYNAMRYMDHCIKKFMEDAATKSWFKNTVFLFIGDHGIRGDAGKLLPDFYTQKALTSQHVPLLIYSPLLQPKEYNFPVSQIDVMPTVAGIADIPYRNTTLGRDLLKIAKDSTQPKFAFTYDIDNKEFGIIDEDNFYYKSLQGNKQGLIPISSNSSVKSIDYYSNLGNGIWEISKYLMYHNK